MGGKVPVIARPGRPSIGFTTAHFLVVTDSSVRVVWPPTWPVLPVLLLALGARGGTGLRGLSSLDC